MGRSGRRETGDLSVVEFLPPDESAFGSAAGSGAHRAIAPARSASFDDRGPDGGRRRHQGGRARLGALAVAVAVVAGVVAVSPWSDGTDGDDGDVPELPAPVDELPSGRAGDGVPSAAPDASAAARDITWVLEPPPGFVPIDSFEQPHRAPVGSFDLWASIGATRSEGRWFALHLMPGSRPVLAPGGDRVVLPSDPPGVTAVRWRTPDDVVHLQWSPRVGYDARLTSFGIPSEQLVDLAASVTVTGDGGYSFGLPPGVGDVAPLVAGPTAAFGLEHEALAGDASSFVEWRAPDGRRITLTAATPAASAAAVSGFAFRPAAPAALDDPAVRSWLDEVGGTAGQVPGLGLRHAVRWQVGDLVLSVAADLALPELVEIARTVRPATRDEWVALERDVSTGRSTSSRAWVDVGGGDTGPGGVPYAAFLNVLDGRLSIAVGSTVDTVDLDDGVTTFAAAAGTVVVVSVPPGDPAVGGRALALLSSDSTDTVVADLIVLDPGRPGVDGPRVGVWVVTEPGPLVVELLDRGGGVIASEFVAPVI